MDDRGRIALSIGLGALLGGVAGYLVFTERGRELRDNLAPKLDDLMTEVEHLRTTFDRARGAVADGLQSFNQLLSEERQTARAARAGDGQHGPRTQAH